MTNIERILLQEIATLPPSRRTDVLAFVRYLKSNIPNEDQELEKQFDRALKSIRTRAQKLNITQAEIHAEIRAVRAEQT